MSQRTRKDSIVERQPSLWAGPSEFESHSEHQAALDATLFRSGGDAYELVLELDAGELRSAGPASAEPPPPDPSPVMCSGGVSRGDSKKSRPSGVNVPLGPVSDGASMSFG